MTITYARAELGVDGSHAFALLGPDLMEGEAEFVEIRNWPNASYEDERRAARQALAALRLRLNRPGLSYYLGPSHP